jgi:hypothetical protein
MHKGQLVGEITLMLLLSLCLTAANIIAFILKISIVIYLLFSGCSGFFFAISIKNLKWGLFYICLSVFLAATFSWACIVSPALLYAESGMTGYVSELFLQFIARMSILSFPVVLFALLFGSIVSDGV